MEQVISYIDGFNLYFGLKSRGWKHLYWLNVQRLSESLLKGDQRLVMVKYFTARISQPQDKRQRQQAFLEATETLCGCKTYYGKYQLSPRRCSHCGLQDNVPNEKMTDVNIAVEMLEDAFLDRFDTALLISADSDLVAPIEAIKKLFPSKRVVLAFPPGRFSSHLAEVGHSNFVIGRSKLHNCQFPDEVVKPGGFVLRKPDSWR